MNTEHWLLQWQWQWQWLLQNKVVEVVEPRRSKQMAFDILQYWGLIGSFTFTSGLDCTDSILSSVLCLVFKKFPGLCLLEDTARYAGLLLAPAEGFCLRPRLFLPFDKKRAFYAVLPIFGNFWCQCFPLSFPILGGRDSTRALQSSPFQKYENFKSAQTGSSTIHVHEPPYVPS